MNLTDRDRSVLNVLVVSLCCCIVLEVVLLVSQDEKLPLSWLKSDLKVA